MNDKKTTDPASVDFRAKFDLHDRVVVITGGVGLIGRALCEACAQFGARVVVADLSPADTKKAADELSRRRGSECLGVAVNVDERSSVVGLRDRVLKRFGCIDGLVNAHQNKTAEFFAKFEDYDDENWEAVIRTNLHGVFLTCQIVGTWMADNGGGTIVNFVSTYSVVAPNQKLYKKTALGCPAAYSASKGGVDALSRYLASYWADKKVRVNMITPHGVWNSHDPQFEENFASFSPMKRMSCNHEVAGALIYLLSDASSYVTGDNMLIEGGWTVW